MSLFLNAILVLLLHIHFYKHLPYCCQQNLSQSRNHTTMPFDRPGGRAHLVRNGRKNRKKKTKRKKGKMRRRIFFIQGEGWGSIMLSVSSCNELHKVDLKTGKLVCSF